jgi:hypothetical protein
VANLRSELKSRHAYMRRLYDDLKGSSFARAGWNTEVRARRTLGSDDTVEHWFLAEHFLITWSNWRGLFDRFRGYFGQPEDAFPKTWAQMITNCDVLVYQLAREEELDQLIAKSWIDPDLVLNRVVKRHRYDIASIYTQIARGHERAALLVQAERAQPKFARTKKDIVKQSAPESVARDRVAFAMARSVAFEQNEQLLELWHTLPRRVQHQAWTHLRHYLHAVLGVSWLVDTAAGVSALLSLSLRNQPMSLSLQKPDGLPGLDSPISGSVARLLDRLRIAIAELGYEAVIEDLSSAELIGGEDSLLASEDVMVVPGHLADTSRPIVLAATKGWSGKEPQSFAKVMRQVKARLIESRGTIQVVVVFCDCWDSASFEDEQREELRAHDQNGIRFVFVLVGVPDKTLVPIPVEFV